MATAMASAATPFSTLSCCSRRRPAVLSSSSPICLNPRNPKSHAYGSIPQLGLGSHSPWCGLKRLGVSSLQNYRKKERKGTCRGRVYASLFGVGAPEALVIGVVALLVFGPKGLAEIARNLGKTLRDFQPTIRELQEVSREFKSTLEREIGLDEVASSTNNSYKSTSSFTNESPQAVVDPNGSPSTTRPYSSEELVKITEDQLAASATKLETQESDPVEPPQGTVTTTEAASTPATPAAPTAPEVVAQIPPLGKAESEKL